MAKAARRQQHHSTDDYVFRPRIVRDEERDVRRRIQRIYQANASIDQQFRAFRKANPQVERWLVEQCRELKARGKKRYSMTALFQVMRWEEDLRTEGDGFKLNNNYAARYARYLMHKYPDLDGFFQTRTLKRKRKP